MRFAPLVIALAISLTAPALAEAREADKAQEREVRSLQKEVSKLEKRYDKLLKRCQGDEHNRADARACDTARVMYQDMQQLKQRLVALTKG